MTRLLLFGLFACGLSLYARVTPLAQQSGTVTVRPRVTATQPGVPEVKVTVDRNRVPVGSEVTFALAPARIVSDPRYRVTLFFGDGKRQLVRLAKVSHVYPQSGTYTFSVLVESERQSTPTPTPVPPVPGVKLSMSSNSVEVNRPVTFSAQLSRRYQNLKYRFVFGDGSDTGWQDDAKATHTYHTASSYRVYVDVGILSNGSVKQAAGSQRESIKVTEPPRPVNASVKLTANSDSIEPGKSVTFAARVNPQSTNARYRFDFGDKSVTGWQTSPSATHRYNAAGKYSARVELRVTNRTNAPQTATDATTIEVKEPAGKLTVDLKIIPSTVPFGLPVLFQALPSAPSANAVYRFNFGDASAPSGWSADPIQAHLYSAARNYPAFVEMAISGGAPVASGRKQVKVLPIPRPSGNQNSNSGNNSNSNAPPGSNANKVGNPNVAGNANSSGGKSNVNGNANSSLNGQVKANTNSPANINFNLNANANGNRNTNVRPNGKLTNAANANAGASPNSSETPQSTGGSEPTEWWKYLIIAAIILFAAYQAYSYLLAPRPTFVPNFDPGDSRVGAGKPLSIELQLDVDPNTQGGESRIDTQGNSLIKAKRTEP